MNESNQNKLEQFGDLLRRCMYETHEGRAEELGKLLANADDEALFVKTHGQDLLETIIFHPSTKVDECERMYGDCVRLLLRKGAPLPRSFDALHACAQNHSSNVLKAFIENGVDVNMQDGSGDTLLVYMAADGRADIVRVLCECARVDVNFCSRYGVPALTRACMRPNNIECVRALMEAGADVGFASRPNGYTCLSAIALHCTDDDVQTLELLLAAGADPYKAHHQFGTPWQIIVKRMRVERHRLLRCLIRHYEPRDLKEYLACFFQLLMALTDDDDDVRLFRDHVRTWTLWPSKSAVQLSLGAVAQKYAFCPKLFRAVLYEFLCARPYRAGFSEMDESIWDFALANECGDMLLQYGAMPPRSYGELRLFEFAKRTDALWRALKCVHRVGTLLRTFQIVDDYLIGMIGWYLWTFEHPLLRETPPLDLLHSLHEKKTLADQWLLKWEDVAFVARWWRENLSRIQALSGGAGYQEGSDGLLEFFLKDWDRS